MTTIEFSAFGIQRTLAFTTLGDTGVDDRITRGNARRAKMAPGVGSSGVATTFDATSLFRVLSQTARMRSRLPSLTTSDLAVVTEARAGTASGRDASSTSRTRSPAGAYGGQVTLVTPTIIVEGARSNDIQAARNVGAQIIDEGFDGKVLLSVTSIDDVSKVIALLTAREVGSATPNFLRRYARTPLSITDAAWAHKKLGLANAWKLTRGAPSVRVAVLDEGVDTSHPQLHAAVVGEQDFIGDKGNSAMPDGNDAHGTACAGIVLARGTAAPGIAPACSLLAARIAMDDGNHHWIFEDFATADAIDWAWRHDASVISNSWGGGVPSDAISRAFGRARTQGRAGKGSVVCIAAGNKARLIDFPGDLPGYVTVGASNQADERKTRTSSDGESLWGSNFGPTLWLLAPGVRIHTTDIAGAAGYDAGDFTPRFNGTSSATPHVAGAVALMLSVNPRLTANTVRAILATTAKRIGGQPGWTKELGYGRLDVAAAVAAAKAHP